MVLNGPDDTVIARQPLANGIVDSADLVTAEAIAPASSPTVGNDEVSDRSRQTAPRVHRTGAARAIGTWSWRDACGPN